jgi:hypothetical protein
MTPAVRRTLLGAALGAATWLVFFAPRPNTDVGVVEPATSRGNGERRGDSAVDNASNRTTSAANDPIEILELRPRAASSARTDALFGSTAWVAPPKPAAPPAPPPPAAPRAPQLPFVFIGKRFDGVRWEVYVSRGADTLILRESDLIDGTYRVDSVRPPDLSVTYLPLNEKQLLVIGPAE